ncbi:Rad52/Rad22 family DNA repair protein [Gloeomargarita sp.]
MSGAARTNFDVPKKPGEWTLAQITEALSRPLPSTVLETKQLEDGRVIEYVPWHKAILLLNKYAPGWQWEIRQIYTTNEDLFLIGRLTIPTAEGLFYREASGRNSLKDTGYGDASSNAESMAFRRAAAKFGLALYLYNK